MKAAPKISKTARALAVATAVIYGIFFTINLFLQFRLNELVKERDGYIEMINKNSQVEEQVKIIDRVIKLYKDTRLQNPSVSSSLEKITTALQKIARIEGLIYNRDEQAYEILSNDRRATAFATLIRDLLEVEGVHSITIDYVEYAPKEGIYTANLKVKMR